MSTKKHIPAEYFRIIEQRYAIEFPHDIKQFYTQTGISEDDLENIDLYRSITDGVEKNYPLSFVCFYSEQFAREVIRAFQKLTAGQLNKLVREVEDYVPDRDESLDATTVLEHLLLGGDEFYNQRTHRFEISLLQQVNELMQDDPERLIEAFVLWAHCGGFGALALNTRLRGYQISLTFGEFPTIEVDGVQYEYYNDSHHHRNARYLI